MADGIVHSSWRVYNTAGLGCLKIPGLGKWISGRRPKIALNLFMSIQFLQMLFITTLIPCRGNYMWITKSSSSSIGQGNELQVRDRVTARKFQKALQEKWRRDRLSEQFIELENLLDRGRYKKDKETLIDDTIETLLGLTAEVNRLKAEAAMLSEQSHELTQERNELKVDTASLKSEIGNLKNIHQYQQRLMFMHPWPPIDPMVVIAPMPYSFPVALPVPPAQIPMHPIMRPFPCFGIQNPGPVPNASSAFVPYPARAHPGVNHLRTSYASTSRISSNGSEASNRCWSSNIENGYDSNNDLDTVLELKTPGSTSRQEFSRGDRKGKRPLIVEKSTKNKSLFASRYSSRG